MSDVLDRIAAIAAERESQSEATGDTKTVYLGYTITERPRYLVIRAPDGSLVMAGRISMAVARSVVERCAGPEKTAA